MSDEFEGDMLESATSFMRTAFGRKMRADGLYFSEHSKAVASYLQKVMDIRDEGIIAVALLQYTLESGQDVDVTDITESFGPHVASRVLLLTRDPRSDDPEAEWKKLLGRLCETSDEALKMVMIADRAKSLPAIRVLPIRVQQKYIEDTENLIKILGRKTRFVSQLLEVPCEIEERRIRRLLDAERRSQKETIAAIEA